MQVMLRGDKKTIIDVVAGLLAISNTNDNTIKDAIDGLKHTNNYNIPVFDVAKNK